MRFSIRTRLTLLIALVFLTVLFFLLAAGALALYFGLNEEIDKSLRADKKWTLALFEGEFYDLTAAGGANRAVLREKLLEELNEIYGHKNQFVLFALKADAGKWIAAGGALRDSSFSLPKSLPSGPDGHLRLHPANKSFRAIRAHRPWGTLVIGAENRTFHEIVDEFREMLSLGLPLIFGLVLIGGWFLARLVMRPVVSAAEAAKTITLSNLSQRLPSYPGHDEFGRLVETLNLMISRLEHGVARIRQFTQDAAHELRTPLTILRGELEMLYQQSTLPASERGGLQSALDRAISMSRIVEDLMLLAQTDAGRYPIRKAPVRLDLLLHDIVEDVRILAEGRPITVSLSPCSRVEFLGDAQLLRRLLLNISDNALKFTESGEISFLLRENDTGVEICVRDTGEGIPREDLPHIFERFYRVRKSRSRASGGSGLGLAIARWIVQAHNGTIAIDSEADKGTCISIRLPAMRG